MALEEMSCCGALTRTYRDADKRVHNRDCPLEGVIKRVTVSRCSVSKHAPGEHSPSNTGRGNVGDPWICTICQIQVWPWKGAYVDRSWVNAEFTAFRQEQGL